MRVQHPAESHCSAEKRGHQRYAVPGGTFAFLKTRVNRIGAITDISRGGLGFTYIHDSDIGTLHPLPLDSVDIFNRNGKIYLKNVTCRIAYDMLNPPDWNYPTSVFVRRCGLHFEEATSDEQQILDVFLKSVCAEESAG